MGKIRLRQEDDGLFYFEVLSSNGNELSRSSEDDYTQKHNAVSGLKAMARVILKACGADPLLAENIKFRDWTKKSK